MRGPAKIGDMRRRSLVLAVAALAVAVIVALSGRAPLPVAARVAATTDSPDGTEPASLAASTDLPRDVHPNARKRISATETATWRVVDQATGGLVLDATVECTDARGRLSTAAQGGTFTPIGEAPFLLEVAAPNFATRWVLLLDTEPVDVWLWRSGSAVVRVVDEAGHAVPTFVFELAPPEHNYEGEPETSCVGLFEHFVEEGEPVDLAELDKRSGRRALDPQCTFPIGPSTSWLKERTDRTGSMRFDGLPIGDYSVRTEDERTVRSTVLGTPPENQRDRVFRSVPATLTAGATIEFELVRSGSAAARVFLGASAFDIEADLHRMDHTLPGGRPFRRSRATVDFGTLEDVYGEVRLVGMDPGRHLLSLRWQLPPDDGGHAEVSQICFKELVFDVTAGVDIDLDFVEPDAGRLDLEFALVDPAGMPIAPDRAFALCAEVPDPERRHAELDVRLEIAGTVVSSRKDFRVPIEKGCRRLVVRGAPRSPRHVTLVPDVDEPTGFAHWAFGGSSTHVVPSEADGRVTIPVAMHASKTMTFVATLPVEDASRDLALVPNGIFAVTLTEVSTGHVHEFALVAKTAFSTRLEATTTVPLGRWRTSNHLVVPCRSDIEYFDSDGRWYTNLIDCERAEWFVLHEEFVVSSDGAAVHDFTPLRAAQARIVGNGTGVDLFRRLQPSERAVQWRAGAPAAWVRLTGCDMENLALELGVTGIELFGLPPSSRVRWCDDGFEFETGPPGSTVEVVVPLDDVPNPRRDDETR